MENHDPYKNFPDEIHPFKNFTPRANPAPAQPAAKTEAPLDLAAIEAMDLSSNDSLALIGRLMPLAIASLDYLLRHANKFPTQAIAAAKIVLERKLGAVPDTMIQNNTQYIIKWMD